MSAMAIAILILIASRDSGTPNRTATKLLMVDVDTSVNNIGYSQQAR